MSTRLAFASTDGRTVNEHFGSASRFHIFTLTLSGPRRTAIIDCETGEGHDSGRLATRIKSLADCKAVLCTAVGQGALRELRGAGIEAIRVAEGSSITELLNEWTRGALSAAARPAQEEKRFDQFLDEGWSA